MECLAGQYEVEGRTPSPDQLGTRTSTPGSSNVASVNRGRSGQHAILTVYLRADSPTTAGDFEGLLKARDSAGGVWLMSQAWSFAIKEDEACMAEEFASKLPPWSDTSHLREWTYTG